MEQWVVHKFGGTSVASAERYRHVAGILDRRPEARKSVVVSAMSGVTDSLMTAVELATRRDRGYLDVLEKLRKRHADTIIDLSAVEYCGSLGIRMLLAAARAMTRRGLRVVVAGLQPPVRLVFETTALDTILTIEPDLEAARRRLAG